MLTRTGVLTAALPLVLVAVTCASAATVVAPVHTQTYADAAGDADAGGIDLTSVKVSDDADGTIHFAVALDAPEIPTGDRVSVYVDADNKPTGAPLGLDYWLDVTGGAKAELKRWNNHHWSVIQSKSFRESFDAGVVTFSVKRTELGIGKAFRFQAFSMVVDANGDAAFDYVPAQHETASYTMGTAPPKPKKKR